MLIEFPKRVRRRPRYVFNIVLEDRLARLWQQQGRRKEALELLAPVYNWLSEGFDTQDLKEAKALLNALA